MPKPKPTTYKKYWVIKTEVKTYVTWAENSQDALAIVQQGTGPLFSSERLVGSPEQRGFSEVITDEPIIEWKAVDNTEDWLERE